MSRIFGLLTAVVVLGLIGCQSSPMSAAREMGWNHYGAAGADRGQTVALAAVRGGEANAIVEGTITDVCPKKGCWMRVTDGTQELFVRFKDYGFFVPMNAAGHEVVMHGTAVRELTSVDELRHYAQDAGKSAEEIALITEPAARVIFFADSVYIAGADLDPPHAE